MKCVILQPSYIPWRGYFDLIRRADVFVFYDDVQYDKGGWRNRNRVKTPQGSRWLTIPVTVRGITSNKIPINAIHTADERWPSAHLQTLTRLYEHAPYFDRRLLESFFDAPSHLLADFTIATTIDLASILGYGRTRFLRSSDLDASGRGTDRLLDILRNVGATHYLSGPSAKNYLDEEKLAKAG